jgi:hypothetical protein
MPRLVRPAEEAYPERSPITARDPALAPESLDPGPLTPREVRGYVVWGFIAGFVAAFEILAAFDGDATPWPTLSRTAANLQEDYTLAGPVILAVLVVLAARIVFYPWPYRKGES